MESERSLPSSQQPAIRPYSEPDASSPHLPILSYPFSVDQVVPKNLSKSEALCNIA
jgi:hypothetical protein